MRPGRYIIAGGRTDWTDKKTHLPIAFALGGVLGFSPPEPVIDKVVNLPQTEPNRRVR